MDKFKNKYRVKSHRMPGWDYSDSGMYYITFVTQNRKCVLGWIIHDHIQLSKWGQIVRDEWLKSFMMRKELVCDEYTIMPNHIHAILILSKMNESVKKSVETHGRASLQSRKPTALSENSQSDFFRKPQSISSFVGGFKSSVNSKIDDYIDEHNLNILKYNKSNHFFQPNYHDHIIRDHAEYIKIKQYIIENARNWNADKLNPDQSHDR